MTRIRSNSVVWGASLLSALLIGICAAPSSYGVVLLDDSYEDELFLGTSESPNLPDETVFWVGRPGDAVEGNGAGAARYFMNASSQKGWWNFAPANQFSPLGNGDSLTVTIDFIPRGAINFDDTSRSWRFGVFHDPTDRVVEEHANDDGGGDGDPFTDAEGYGVQMAFMSDPNNTRTVFDAGKRTDLANTSLLGSSGAYIKNSGGDPIAYVGNIEYSFEQVITRVSNSLTTYTTSIYDAAGGSTGGGTLLSTHTVNDDGAELGTDPAYSRFSFVGFRNSTNTESAAAYDFTRIVVEGPALVPEPATLLLGALCAPFALLRRRR